MIGKWGQGRVLLCSSKHCLLAMSIVAPHSVLRPFVGVKPGGGPYLGRHSRFGLRLRVSSSVEAANGEAELQSNERRRKKKKAVEELSVLEVLYDDGFGDVTMKDYLETLRAMPRDDGGPPRWFCPVECGRPEVERAPLLIFLPGTIDVGMGLILQHKSLGKVYEVICMHIPLNDRTPFEGLLQMVEECVKHENDLLPSRPIYIVGDSLGGCLAISVAARNPKIDLVLILVNPAIAKSPLQAILPLLEAVVPSKFSVTQPHLLRYLIGDPLNIAMVSIQNDLFLQESLKEFSDSFSSVLPFVSDLGDILQIDTLVWKLKLLRSGAAYANSHLPEVQAEVLLLASGNENLPPNGVADQLYKTLRNCKVRYFRNRGDRLLMENGFNLLTVIKGANMYRRGRQRDFVADFLPPTLSEFKKTFHEDFKSLHQLLSPVMLSTMNNGKIVRGLTGIPDKGPVLFVGYHQLLALEVSSLLEEFMREKKKVVRSAAHSVFFVGNYETLRQELSLFDAFSMYGAVPVTPANMYKLFERNEFVLLYPGGIREALHRKGEGYRLFWPEQPEFVRMAARFGVTVIPFGCVGEDDFFEIALDYNDLKNIPYIRDEIKSFNKDLPGVRDTVKGEEGNQVLHLPAVLPKLPGRLYFLFGKPIEMKGMGNVLADREKANQVYLQIKSEVDDIMCYLKRKREEDPYRSLTRRMLYQATWGASAHVPTFEP